MTDLENLIEILNLIDVDDDWYTNEEIAEKLIAHGVKYVPPQKEGVTMTDEQIIKAFRRKRELYSITVSEL